MSRGFEPLGLLGWRGRAMMMIDDREAMERRGDGMSMNCTVVADERSDAVILLRSERASQTCLTARISLSKCPARPFLATTISFLPERR